MSSEKLSAIIEAARAEKALDPDSAVLLNEAIEERETNSALEILARAADCLGESKPMPRLIELYLAYSLQSIALGEEPTQALHLRRNGRPNTRQKDLMELYFTVEWHKRNGARSEKEAIRRAATQFGLKAPAAEKRFAKANASAGETFRLLSDAMRARSVRVPTLGQALGGATTTEAADDLITRMVDLFGAPKEGA